MKQKSAQPVSRISIDHLAVAIRKVLSMSQTQKLALADEVFKKQPNLLGSCLVQPRFGVAAESVEFLLNILFVCFQAMKESGGKWPLITEDEQERQMKRLPEMQKHCLDGADPVLADTALARHVNEHPEQPLLAFVANELQVWL